MKELSGDKYIYYAMAYQLAVEHDGKIRIGHDNGYVGGNKYVRWFEIVKYKNDILLVESKITAGSAFFMRTYRVSEGEHRPHIYEYINEDGDNCSKTWTH